MELLEIQEEHYRKQPKLNPSHKKLIIIEHFFTSVRVCVRHFKLIIWKIPKLFLSKCVETTDWRMYHLRLAVPADMLTSALHLLLLYGEISFHPHTVTDSLIHTKKWEFFSWGKRKGDEQCLQNKYKPRAQLAMNEIKEVRTKTYSANQAPLLWCLVQASVSGDEVKPPEMSSSISDSWEIPKRRRKRNKGVEMEPPVFTLGVSWNLYPEMWTPLLTYH